MQTYFASCARGFEEILKQELSALGADECQLTQGGVYFSKSQGNETENLKLLYQSLLYSRYASRILLPIQTVAAFDEMTLYIGVKQIDWPAIIAQDASIMVNFIGTSEEIRNTQFGAQRVKDAIVDRYLQDKKERPHVEKQDPDLRIHVFLSKDKAQIALDLSTNALNQRGYRTQTGAAPLKETLGAVIVKRSGWDTRSPLIDPFCGSGTLLIEAAMLAANMPASILRYRFGFYAWQGHRADIWQDVKEKAKAIAQAGKEQLIARCQETGPLFIGYDNDPVMIRNAQKNADELDLPGVFHFETRDITELTNPFDPSFTGTLIMNPPYGERLHSEPELIALYGQIGLKAKQFFKGWQLSVFTSSEILLSSLQLRSSKQFKAKNGPLECIQKNYSISANQSVVAEGINTNNVPNNESKRKGQDEPGLTATIPTSDNGIAQDFANRLKKNLAKFDKWAKKEGVECYRIYDADLPEYNVAVDRYGAYVVLQEYAPPKTIDEHVARKRRFDAINTTLAVLQLTPQQLILKTRERQSGQKQYHRIAKKENMIEVSEYHAKFWVNLTDYLDTGLFIDHRLARKQIGQMAKAKDFLNLFCYTGSASVYAALGGARSTTSVDLSNTYLNWAEKNLLLNGISGKQHQLVQADCLYWLSVMQEEKPQYDLIFVDPPTFSNSKRMHETFDVQRDYLTILEGLKTLLRPLGTILFSNNRRGFKLDIEAVNTLGFNAVNISEKTLSQDFMRNKQIHQSWLITHKID